MFEGRGLEGGYGAARRTTLIADTREKKAGRNRMISAFDNEEKNNGPTTQR